MKKVVGQPHPEKTLHSGEPLMDKARVGALLQAQFPELANLPLEPCAVMGTTHWVYRLGDAFCVRLPRVSYGDAAIKRAEHWQDGLTSQLSLSTPTLIATGSPTEEYPFHWSICSWVKGRVLGVDDLDALDAAKVARELVALLGELRRADTLGAPECSRARDLAFKDAETREAIVALGERVDSSAALSVWEEGLNAARWCEAPVWVHGDLLPGNLLVGEDGAPSAVLDFDGAGVGDPACDLTVAWSVLNEAGRRVLRESCGASDAMWARGRAHALSQAMIFLPYYEGRHADGEAVAWRQLREILGEDAVK